MEALISDINQEFNEEAQRKKEIKERRKSLQLELPDNMISVQAEGGELEYYENMPDPEKQIRQKVLDKLHILKDKVELSRNLISNNKQLILEYKLLFAEVDISGNPQFATYYNQGLIAIEHYFYIISQVEAILSRMFSDDKITMLVNKMT